MCNAQAAMVMQGAGAVNSAVGAYYSAKSSKVSLQGQANVADINARMAEGNAQAVLLAGQREEQKVRLNTAQLKSTQRARLAANGVDLGEGSAANELAATEMMGEIDANTVAANAIRSAWGYRVDAANQTSQGTTSRASAQAVSPFMSGATSLLGGAGQVAASWYRLKEGGTPGAPTVNYPQTQYGPQ